MSKLELTINTNYIRDWDLYAGIRELIQNAADADDLGYPMEIKYNSNRKDPVLSIINHGITIGRDALLLGATTKADDDRTRGCFGEGFKLSYLVLVRNGLKVWCKSGKEKWVPSIEYSEKYGSDLLTIDTGAVKYENCVKVEVRGLSPEDWEDIKSKILFSPGNKPKPNEMIDLGSDKILTAERYKGHLFVRGLWVCYMPGKYWFGYDLHDLKLDRDRKLADPWDLKNAIRNTLNDACKKETISPDEFYSIFSGDWEESLVIADTYGGWSVTDLAARITNEFHKKNGLNAIAVETTSESVDAHQHGMRGVVVSKAVKKLVEFIDGKFEDKKISRALEIEKTYGIQDLEEEEIQNFSWSMDLLIV